METLLCTSNMSNVKTIWDSEHRWSMRSIKHVKNTLLDSFLWRFVFWATDGINTEKLQTWKKWQQRHKARMWCRFACCTRCVNLSCQKAFLCWIIFYFGARNNKTLVSRSLDCSRWLHLDAPSECVRSSRLCCCRSLYTASCSEMIFTTFLVMRMRELGPDCSYYGPGVPSTSKQACGWINPVPTHWYTHTLTRSHTILIISAKLLHYLIRTTLCSG